MHASNYIKRILVISTLLSVWLVYADFNHHVLHPYNWTNTLLQLPWTDLSLYSNAYSLIHRVPVLEWTLKEWYTLGFTITLVCAVAWFLITRKPKEIDAGLLGLAVMLGTAMTIYTFAFVYPPHIVYGFNPIKSPLMHLANNRFVFPSLHSALTAFIAIYFLWKENNPIIKGIFILNGMATPVITIILVQHWVYDAIAGILLAVISFKIAEKYGESFSQALDGWNPDKHTLTATTAAVCFFGVSYSLLKIFVLA